MDDYEEAWSEYHESFIKRKNEIITKLVTIRSGSSSSTHRAWLTQAIEFIKEQKG